MIEDRIFKIEYESLENICFDYGCYGHKKETCPGLVPKPPSERVEMEPDPEPHLTMSLVTGHSPSTGCRTPTTFLVNLR
ncbi:hypothetical protein LINPERHAP2_LOCUS16842 [Linum perenne]